MYKGQMDKCNTMQIVRVYICVCVDVSVWMYVCLFVVI
jgi:hypothetical protein